MPSATRKPPPPAPQARRRSSPLARPCPTRPAGRHLCNVPGVSACALHNTRSGGACFATGSSAAAARRLVDGQTGGCASAFAAAKAGQLVATAAMSRTCWRARRAARLANSARILARDFSDSTHQTAPSVDARSQGVRQHSQTNALLASWNGRFTAPFSPTKCCARDETVENRKDGRVPYCTSTWLSFRACAAGRQRPARRRIHDRDIKRAAASQLAPWLKPPSHADGITRNQNRSPPAAELSASRPMMAVADHD
jgi:hypothetical protein